MVRKTPSGSTRCRAWRWGSSGPRARNAPAPGRSWRRWAAIPNSPISPAATPTPSASSMRAFSRLQQNDAPHGHAPRSVFPPPCGGWEVASMTSDPSEPRRRRTDAVPPPGGKVSPQEADALPRHRLWGSLSPFGLGIAALVLLADQAHKAWMLYIYD